LAFESLDITEFPDALGSDLFHFAVAKPDFNGRLLRGFGSAGDRSLALQKAVGELIERSAFFTDPTAPAKRTSSGYASHENEAQARENAQAELIERDIVLCHWLQKIAPFWLKENALPLETSERLLALNRRLHQLGYNFTPGLLAQVGETSVACGLLRATSGKIGFTFSSAAKASLPSAIESVISDARRNITILESRVAEGASLFRRMREEEILDPDAHREFYFDPANVYDLDWFFTGSQDVLTYDIPAIHLETIPIPIQVDWHCTAVRASSPDLQAYFTGPTRAEHLNLGRLGVSGELEGLFLRPHPLP